jgi:peptidase E
MGEGSYSLHMAIGSILAMGGFPVLPLLEHALQRAGRRLLYVGTAGMESAAVALDFHQALRRSVETFTVVRFHPWPPDGLRELVLGHDVVFVPGGSTANMLAIWRVHGFDRLLRDAWEQGALLCGVSAGAICWFEAGVTDSFGPQLEGMRDGLGFLAGSACPHYDGEELRRPVYRRLVDDEGFPPGVAIDDGAAVLYRGTERAEVLSCRDGATAYDVAPGSETAFVPRRL